jgi:uncharacterized protein YeaO (DUF488 family)
MSDGSAPVVSQSVAGSGLSDAVKGEVTGDVIPMIQIKRAYDPAAPDDGVRYLVDRLWPRGVRKDSLQVDAWLKEVAPSDDLRKWFGHDSERWEEFQKRYFAELDAHPAAWQPLIDAARKSNVTLLYSARDTEHNNAQALKTYLERQLAG